MSAWGSRVGGLSIFLKKTVLGIPYQVVVFGAKDFSEIARHQLVRSGMLKLKLSRVQYSFLNFHKRTLAPVCGSLGEKGHYHSNKIGSSHTCLTASDLVSSVVPLPSLSLTTQTASLSPQGVGQGRGETFCDLWNTLGQSSDIYLSAFYCASDQFRTFTNRPPLVF